MKGETIKGFAIAILIIGGLCGLIYGRLNPVISAEYLSNMAKYPLTYTIDKAEYVFDWVSVFSIWIAFAFTFFIVYSIGVILRHLERIVIALYPEEIYTYGKIQKESKQPKIAKSIKYGKIDIDYDKEQNQSK